MKEEYKFLKFNKRDGLALSNVKSKVKVAIIDSGVDIANDVAIAGSINLIPEEEEFSPLFWDVTGHGSSIAGLIAAMDNNEGITGVNPNVEIYSARVLDHQKVAPISRIIEAIYWSMEQDVNIINMSFGTLNYSPALEDAIKEAAEQGILLIAAAGNTGNRGVEYPAAFEEVMAIGSVDSEGVRCQTSAIGDEVEVMAPGESIRSTGAFGGTVICSGTSMSAAQVTGVASLIWEKDLNASADFVRGLLRLSSNFYGSKNQYGSGVIDAAYAMKCYQKYKKMYEKQTFEEEKLKNNNPVVVFDDVDYVNGSWFFEGHEQLVQDAAVGTTLTTAQITTIKSGATYPDYSGSSLNGLVKHPEWHGGPEANYIACYIYLTNIANAVYSGKATSTATVPSGLSTSNQNSLIGGVNQINWINTLATPSNPNRGLFIWGMALHTATDAYAHSAYKKGVNGGWYKLTHYGNTTDHDYADNIRNQFDSDVNEERFNTARLLVKSSISRIVKGITSSGSVDDFNPYGGYVKAGTHWKIAWLKDYAYGFSTFVSKELSSYSYSYATK